jgi:hypothetical protein
VILGATDKARQLAAARLAQSEALQFSGCDLSVQSGRDAVWDTRCYRNFRELPESPIIWCADPGAGRSRRAADGAKAGARSATVMTSGFDEVGRRRRTVATVETRRLLKPVLPSPARIASAICTRRHVS